LFWLKNHWGISLLILLLLIIVAVSIKPGKLILGNDNFSPELNPALTLERSLNSPAFRTYRVLGLPSDSEQADIFRTTLFFFLKPILPTWVLSQGYLFFTFFIASFSMAALCGGLLSQIIDKKIFQKAFFFGGLFYLSSMLTSWIYFFPVQLFVAAYAFLPLVLWRFYVFHRKASVRNAFFLLIASLFLSTSALTATLFLTCAAVILVFSCVLFILAKKDNSIRMRALLAGLFIIFAIQSYWIFPFITYVKTNTSALRDSAINREITATTIENEAKYNTALNAVRYYASWMDTKENNVDYTFPYRNWYKNSPLATIISFIPIILAILGSWYGYKKSKPLLIFSLLAFFGWWSIKGINPPLGAIYDYLQNTFPIAAQVLRWQSSKLWPLLAVTIPILATLGIIELSGLMTERFKKYGRKIVLASLGIVGVALIIFVYPYFLGGLVRGSVFTNVPNEYSQLAKYLDANDKFSRIYLAPEANTLYFRNYSWGFWGSVVLSYIIQNPIIEKALTIGSYENEQSFTVIRGAYYSQDPLRFVNALNLYNTPYVLSDKYASKGSVGYAYDWSVNQKVVENNPYLEKVWEQGKLTLYKVKNLQKPSSFTRVFPQTDFTKLNTILSTEATGGYYTQETMPGRIYPFALSFDSLKFGKDEIIGSIVNKQNDGVYRLNLSTDALANIPTQGVADPANKKILFYPIMPYLQVNKTDYIYSLPHKSYLIDTPPSFVAIDGQVMNLGSDINKLKSVSTLYKNITNQKTVEYWSTVFATQSFGGGQISCDKPLTHLILGDKIKCVTTDLNIAKDSIFELRIGLEATNLTQVTVCVYSDYQKACLNKNSTAFINGSNTSTLSIPAVIQKGDSLRIFVNFQTQAKNINLSMPSLSLNIYSDSRIAKFDAETESNSSSLQIPIKKGDQILFHIPVTGGQSSWNLNSEGAYIPESSFAPFIGSNSSEQIKENNGGFAITNKESNVSVFPKLPFLDPQQGLGLLGIAGDNASGIPVEVSLRDQNQQYKLWQRELSYKQNTDTIDLFSLPNAVETYSLETFSTGIGPRDSINTINNLVFETIPASWYGFVLVPNNETISSVLKLSPASSRETNTYVGNSNQTNQIVSISVAYSPNWSLSVDGKNSSQASIRINGWQQGWVLDKSGSIRVWFWPNMLVYLGFIPLGVIIGLLIWYLGKIGLRKAGNFSSKKAVQI
jgi:hypothetical protein